MIIMTNILLHQTDPKRLESKQIEICLNFDNTHLWTLLQMVILANVWSANKETFHLCFPMPTDKKTLIHCGALADKFS